VNHLAELALRFNPWRNAERALQRRVAFIALGYNPSEKAERLLEKLAGSWRPDLKRQANESLRKRPTVITGGGDEHAG